MSFQPKTKAICIDQCLSRRRDPQGVVSYDTAFAFRPLQARPASMAKSQSIPIRKGLHKTPSELQLCEDEALADYRDYIMYSRIVDGIHRRQQQNDRPSLRLVNDECVANITRTRYLPIQEEERRQDATVKDSSSSADYGYWADESMTAAQHDDGAVGRRRTVTPPVHASRGGSVEDEAIFCMDL